MLIQINTDNQVEGDDALIERIRSEVKNSLDRFSDRITRVSAHLSDENSSNKFGPEDKRCLMEARLAGLKPISTSHQAATMEEAVNGAAAKLKRALESTLGRLDSRK